MVDGLTRLYWAQFKKWVKQEENQWRLEQLTTCLEEIYSEFDSENTDKTRLSEKMEVCFIL